MKMQSPMFDLQQLHQDFLNEELLHQSSLNVKQARNSLGIVNPASKIGKNRENHALSLAQNQ